MSKASEALERLKFNLLAEGFWQDVLQDMLVIETALKEREMEHTLRIRLENINYDLVREKQENEKKLKALEIIKEYELLSVFQDENGKFFIIFTGKYGFEIETAIEIPQEKYDLLREVLL